MNGSLRYLRSLLIFILSVWKEMSFPVGGWGCMTGKDLGVLYLFLFLACREQWREKEEELLRCPLFMEIR
jgi:hypothetical protein